MQEEAIYAAIEPHIRNGHLACGDALAAAERLNVKPIEIGRLCDARDIRIVNCQLGCFGTQRKRDR